MSVRRFRLGLYGGSFDPVHQGHLIQAQDALEQASLDAVVWIPCAQSPHKKSATEATAAQRLTLLEKALEDHPHFWISRAEIDRKGPSYTIDTVELFRDALPRAELFLLIGADQLPLLDAWHRAKELRRLVTFLVFSRPGHPLRRKRRGVISLPRPRAVDISATEIRARVKKDLPINHLVPPAVAAHIARRRLYR
ncbi:MAG: nicotinate-nucleotide adenylyltransferase [Verrucomicrobium sp.]|nr:nicotinate-nucleotide adenylyltransferase [Verrucomicrobium sp.]